MSYKGAVSEGSSIQVSFKADHSNNGSSGFFFGYVPKDGSGKENAQFTPVAPGGSETLASTVPSASDVWSLDIRIDVPDDEGSGRLVVRENGKERESSPIARDETWTYRVASSD